MVLFTSCYLPDRLCRVNIRVVSSTTGIIAVVSTLGVRCIKATFPTGLSIHAECMKCSVFVCSAIVSIYMATIVQQDIHTHIPRWLDFSNLLICFSNENIIAIKLNLFHHEFILLYLEESPLLDLLHHTNKCG